MEWSHFWVGVAAFCFGGWAVARFTSRHIGELHSLCRQLHEQNKYVLSVNEALGDERDGLQAERDAAVVALQKLEEVISRRDPEEFAAWQELGGEG